MRCIPFQCLWCTGARNFDWINRNLGFEPLGRIKVKTIPFIEEIGNAYAASDMALSRAGACSVAELMANRVPTLFVPLPGARDDHQKINAQSFVEVGAALLMDEKDMTPALLAETLLALIISREKRAEMSRKAARVAPLDAAQFIAKEIYKKIKNCC